MSMFTDLVWWDQENKELCIANSIKVAGYAKNELWNEELWKAKEVENCLYTSVVIHMKCFFALLFPSISSVSTEQWRTCVKNCLADFWLLCKHGETCCEGQTRDHGLTYKFVDHDQPSSDQRASAVRVAAGIQTKNRKSPRWSSIDQIVLQCIHEDCRSKTVFCDRGLSGTGKIGLSWFMSRIHNTSRWRIIQSKRMDPWKHEDRSSIGGHSQYHQGRYATEIRINSLFGDGSQSWVMICKRLNKYVTEMSQEMQEDRNDERGASAGTPAAKARPKQTSLPRLSSPRV